MASASSPPPTQTFFGILSDGGFEDGGGALAPSWGCNVSSSCGIDTADDAGHIAEEGTHNAFILSGTGATMLYQNTNAQAGTQYILTFWAYALALATGAVPSMQVALMPGATPPAWGTTTGVAPYAAQYIELLNNSAALTTSDAPYSSYQLAFEAQGHDTLFFSAGATGAFGVRLDNITLIAVGSSANGSTSGGTQSSSGSASNSTTGAGKSGSSNTGLIAGVAVLGGALALAAAAAAWFFLRRRRRGGEGGPAKGRPGIASPDMERAASGSNLVEVFERAPSSSNLAHGSHPTGTPGASSQTYPSDSSSGTWRGVPEVMRMQSPQRIQSPWDPYRPDVYTPFRPPGAGGGG